MMEIRYLSKDESEISQIARWIIDEWGYSMPERSVESIADDFRPRVGSSRVPLTLVAIDPNITGSDIIGTASLVAHDMAVHRDLTPWLSCLYVRADRRKQGLAETLMSQVLQETKRLGFKHCYLWTDKWDDYYGKRGWKALFRETYRGERAIIMGIDL